MEPIKTKAVQARPAVEKFRAELRERLLRMRTAARQSGRSPEYLARLEQTSETILRAVSRDGEADSTQT